MQPFRRKKRKKKKKKNTQWLIRRFDKLIKRKPTKKTSAKKGLTYLNKK